jgi:transmembrane sensor
MERHALMEAADWFVRLQDRKVNSGTREKFTEWLLVSPDHVAAFIDVTELYGRAGPGLEDAPSTAELVAAAKADPEASNVVALSTADLQGFIDSELPSPKTRKGWGLRLAMAASLIAVTLFLGWQALSLYAHPRFSTDVGEQLSVPLEDGSLVYLNTNSEFAADLSGPERRITLVRGEARFTVAKDPHRPFIVTTRHATVRALGTIFNVQTAGDRTAVSVIEGRIVVTGQADMQTNAATQPSESRPAPNVVLSTGQQVSVTRTGHLVRDAGPPLERVMAWPNGRLVFRDEPLIDLVTDFNRYHKRPLRIADPALAGHRVNGTFDAYDRLSLIQFLERYEGVRVTNAPDGSQQLTRADATRNKPSQ